MGVERLKKYCSLEERGCLVFWRGFGEGACPQRPVTEPKQSQNPKRPLSHVFLPRSYSIFDIFDNALNRSKKEGIACIRSIGKAGSRPLPSVAFVPSRRVEAERRRIVACSLFSPTVDRGLWAVDFCSSFPESNLIKLNQGSFFPSTRGQPRSFRARKPLTTDH